MRFHTVFALTTAAAFAVAGLNAGTAHAQTSSRLDPQQLKSRLLSDAALSKASGTGYPTVSTGITCAVSVPFDASFCYREYLHSDEAKSAKAPWPTHLNIMSFSSSKKAAKYVNVMAKRFSGTKRVSATPTSVVGVDPQALMNAGLELKKGKEASVVLVQGTRVTWAACGDLASKAATDALVQCARSVAKAQSAKLG